VGLETFLTISISFFHFFWKKNFFFNFFFQKIQFFVENFAMNSNKFAKHLIDAQRLVFAFFKDVVTQHSE